MYTIARLIAQLSDYDTQLTVEELLEEKEFTSLLHGIYVSLPVKSKSKAQRIFRAAEPVKTKSIRSAALTAILDIRAIALPDDIKNLFQTWKENPSQFWKADGAQSWIQWDSGESIENVATKAYLVVRHLNMRRLWDTILWRFYASFFYSLALLLGNGQVNMSDNLYQRLVNTLFQSETITDEITVIKENLRVWTAAGSRYHKICLRLDQGALFLLPQISDNVWENEHSLKGPDFETAMAHLKKQGILKLSDQLQADDLSKRILNFALDPFRWNITLSVPIPGTIITNAHTFEAEPETGTPNCDPTSIGALLNAAEHLAGCTQSQQLHPIRDSLSIADASDLLAPHRKRRRAESVPSLDLCETSATTTSQIPRGMEIAMVAEVDKLASTLGGYLFDGMGQSLMRRAEIDRGMMSFTDTVRLHFAYHEGEDFKLEVWVSSAIGKAISQAKSTSAEDLRRLIGDYLFGTETMELSDRARAINVSFPNGDDGSDCKVEVMLCFPKGKEVYGNIYRRYV